MLRHSTAKSSLFERLPPFRDRRKKSIFSSARLAERVKSIKDHKRESWSNPSSPTPLKKKQLKKSHTPPFPATITVSPSGSEKTLSGNFPSSPTETQYDFTPSVTPTQLSQPESIGLMEGPSSSMLSPNSPVPSRMLKKSHTPPFPATIIDPPSDSEEDLSHSFPPQQYFTQKETSVSETQLLQPRALGLKDSKVSVLSNDSALSDDSGLGTSQSSLKKQEQDWKTTTVGDPHFGGNTTSSTSSLLSFHQCQSRRYSLPLSDPRHSMRRAYSSGSCGTRRGSIPYPPPTKSPQRTWTKLYRATPRKYLPKNAHATSALHLVCCA